MQKGRICPKDEKVIIVNDNREIDGVILNEERTSLQKRVSQFSQKLATSGNLREKINKKSIPSASQIESYKAVPILH